jgi:hypothetical protein
MSNSWGSFRLLSNRFLRVTASHSIEQRVEWAYAFDVHCNAFFPVFLILYVVQFFFIPILVRSSWISLLIGNTMYFLSFAWYAYGTFLGYNGKYLDKTQCATVSQWRWLFLGSETFRCWALVIWAVCETNSICYARSTSVPRSLWTFPISNWYILYIVDSIALWIQR